MSGERIFFWPDRPDHHLLLGVMQREMGWTVVDHPDDADWRVLHRDTTLIEPGAADPWEAESASWINGRCRDISKPKVGRIFRETFGHDLEIDPLVWEGLILRKGTRNYAKDGVVLQGPLREVEPGYVYQRFIDTRGALRVPGDPEVYDPRTLEYRVSIVGRSIPAVLRIVSFLSDDGRIGRPPISMFRPLVVDDVFTAPEQEAILHYAQAFHLDFGSVDVMRDQADGRIYVIDTNTTPGAIQLMNQHVRPVLLPAAIDAWYRAFGVSSATP